LNNLAFQGHAVHELIGGHTIDDIAMSLATPVTPRLDFGSCELEKIESNIVALNASHMPDFTTPSLATTEKKIFAKDTLSIVAARV
jgi:hypothetical protein